MSDTREGTFVSTSGRLITQGPPLADLLDDAAPAGRRQRHRADSLRRRPSRCDRSRRLSQHATRVRLWTDAGVLAWLRTRVRKLRTRSGTVRAGTKREDPGAADRVGVAPSDHRSRAAVPDAAWSIRQTPWRYGAKPRRASTTTTIRARSRSCCAWRAPTRSRKYGPRRPRPSAKCRRHNRFLP